MKSLVWALTMASSVATADDNLRNLAEAVYFEARSEPVACQIIVAQTIMNRVAQERFPDTVEGVVHQSKYVQRLDRRVCQYSYFCDGKPDTMSNVKAEIRSYQVASRVLMGDIPDLSEGADHYYAHNITIAEWASKLEHSFTCNNHTFGQLKW